MATTGPFRSMLATMSPTWLSREFGEKFVIGLMGYRADAMMEAATLALKSPWIAEPTSPDDAVALQASETAIRRYPTDTSATHRDRVLTAWGAHEFAGSKSGTGGAGEGIEGQIALLGYPNVVTIADYEWTADTESGTNWSRFWVIIPSTDHAWTSDGIWNDPGTWDDGGLWDISASWDEIRALRDVINDWKSGHEICAGIYVIFGDCELWDYPEGTWDEAGGVWCDAEDAAAILSAV